MLTQNKTELNAEAGSEGRGRSPAPLAINLPKGGGAIRGMGEKFAANPVTGTGSMSIPIATSPGRSGFGPQLSLSYDSGVGNGPFGLGWNLSLPSITRKTDKGLPRYDDANDSDVFILSGAEDLVPAFKQDAQGNWLRDAQGKLIIHDEPRAINGITYRVRRYRPRIEGLFARIERWTNTATGEIQWRSISKDNITTLYGKDNNSRIFDPEDTDPQHPTRVFTWLICQSYDDKGNVIDYLYKAEDSADIDLVQVHETNRKAAPGSPDPRSANRYLKRILYGNATSLLAGGQPIPAIGPDLSQTKWLFEVVFDYGEGHYQPLSAPNDDPQFVRSQSGAPAGVWPVRQDPFSTYRAGFEIRTYRLCRRVLMFHHFDTELGTPDYLVHSTEFTYREEAIGSFVTSVTQSGYLRQPDGRYRKKSLPPLEFDYTRATINPEVKEASAESLENLPMGLDGTAYQWVDLDGEGVSGILTEQAGAWFYKRNLSPLPGTNGSGAPEVRARFAPLEQVVSLPALATPSSRHQFLDLAGNGTLDIVEFSGPTPGFYERTEDEDWKPFTPFRSLPNLSWGDPDVRFVDLDGDGHGDVLITEDEVFTWYRSLGEDGFEPGMRVYQPRDEERGLRLVSDSPTERIYFADLSGDGLTDLVRIRNGEVCYWPNLGYGRFGAKVTMDNSPWFDRPDIFDQKRIRLADIDGSGTTDILYLGANQIAIYRNQSGNSFSDAEHLTAFPRVDNLTSVQAVDLLGNGTACLVWSSPLPGDARRPMRYIDLMGGQKPHLLVKTVNNLGAETVVSYAPSTKFYLKDKFAGKPWITKLPFPVHVVERVETLDCISGNRFVTRHAFHHGYFDGEEREFRGFGMVEQWDTEELAALKESGRLTEPTNIDESSYVPPTYTKTWFHTGVYLGRNHVSDFFAGLLNDQDQGEYYREPGLTDAQAKLLLLPDTVLPDGMTTEEEREACRALKGVMLRQEIYALDGTEKEGIPYTVTEQNFTIEPLQPREHNRHAIFFTHAREAISFQYERNPADPRIAHALTLEVDAFGNVLKGAAVGYGRRQPDMSLLAADQEKQTQTLITYTENTVTNAIESDDDYRTPLVADARTYEITGLTLPPGRSRFSLPEVLTAGTGAVPLTYEQNPTSGLLQKRLIEHIRTLYRRNDLTSASPLGDVQSLGLPFESYKLAFTPELVTAIYGARVTNSMLDAECRYIHSEGDANWWIPSGRIFYSPGSADTAAQELAHAHQHFFLPHRSRDPFHTTALPTESFLTYDSHDLLMLETRDALGNRVTVGERDAAGNLTVSGNDYRVLQPRLVMDANRNRTAVAFDALGMVVGTAVMGKPLPAPVEGDSLNGFEADLTEAVILDHLANPFVNPSSILQRATTRLVYDLFAYQRTKSQPDPQPAVVYTQVRETHDSDPVPVGGLKIQHSFSYSDGFGREIQKKIQSEPGPVPKRDASGKIIVGVNGQPEMTLNDVSPRWVGSGWTVFNNKGKPVRQFEPFFTDTQRFEFDVSIGVSPVIFYDPVERVVATLHPNHTWEKVVFDPWRQETWDVNDTVLVADPKTDPAVADFFARLPDADYLPTWHTQRQGGGLGSQEQDAARKAAIHAATPSVAHADSLGRTFLTIAHNKFKYSDTPPVDPPVEEFHRTRVFLDIEGNQRAVRDAIVQNGDQQGRIVMVYDYDMLGNRIHQASMEAGERWMLNDVAGKSLYAWDSRNHQFRTVYDQLRRPTTAFLQEGAGTELQVGRNVYGETQPNPEVHNLRGKVVQVFDQAGVLTSDDYDFKGNLLRSQRQLAKLVGLIPAYKTTLDWSAVVQLENDIYTSRTSFDALNRPLAATSPDGSVYRPVFNEANLLDKVDVNLRGKKNANGELQWTPFVTNLNYSAKGQRQLIAYGNGAQTTYEYDPLTFRLTKLTTTRPANPDATASQLFKNETLVQDLRYTFDPAGNITRMEDAALKSIFHNGEQVDPVCAYTYDAIYRLLEAKGREHIGQTVSEFNPPSGNLRDYPFAGLADFIAHPNDLQALRNYTQRYEYDSAGNFQSMRHIATGGNWTRGYEFGATSLIEPAKQSNRLTKTTVGNGINFPEIYTYSDALGNDVHGCMTAINAMKMTWNFKDQLQRVDLGGGGKAFYVYDAAGQRARKVIETQNGTRKQERIYLGGFEIYRDYDASGTTVTLERETLHVMDDKQRIALAETQTIENSNPINLPVPAQRYQLGNHLGSASLELSENGTLISYEEYHPYGTTSFQAGRSAAEMSLKRYRFTGKERDEESGLNYHGARYCAPWLARWVSCDPAGLVDGPNLFRYARNTPVILDDPNGMDPDARSYQERSIQLDMNHDTSSGAVSYRLTVELQNPNTNDRYVYSSSGDVTGLRSIHQQLLGNSGFTETLRPEEREGLFSSLESFAQSVGPVPADGQTSDPPVEGRSSGQVEPVERALQVVGDAARGIAADRALPQRYRLEPQRPPSPTVTGIRDTQAGKIRGTPPRPVGAPVIRVDQPHGSTNYPHVNVETLNPDPHIRISPGALRAAAGLARGLEAVGRVARPVAIITDTARLGTAIYEDEGLGRNTARTAASVAGGWAGAFAGAWVGAKAGAALGGVLGSFVPVLGNAAGAAIGGLLGGLIGGIAGGYFGSSAGEHAADRLLE